MKKITRLSSILGMIFLAGCTSTAVPTPEVNENAPQTTVETPQTTGETSTQEKTMLKEEEAKTIVLKEVPNGEIIDIEYDLEDATPTYEFKIREGQYDYDIEIDAYTGTVIKSEKELKVPNQPAEGTMATIDEAKATEIALAQLPEGEVVRVFHDAEDYIPTYDVYMKDGTYNYEFEIDARDGTILKIEKELMNR